MNSSQLDRNCPDKSRLAEYLVGSLDDVLSRAVEDHLAHCPNCLQLLDSLYLADDPLVAQLRRESDFPRESRDGGEGSHLGWVRDYELLAELGRGGMGQVYRASHTRLGRTVAIKMLRGDYHPTSDFVTRFSREIKAVGRLNHPNIVTAFDAGECNGTHYLVMELVDGIDLSRLVKTIGPLAVADACEIICQAADALQHAKRNGLIHRDVKPSNVMITQDGQVKVLDLGLALWSESSHADGELTATGQVMGTLDYMAPEQLGDSHQVDHRVDVYGLGATLYKLLTGQAPFSVRGTTTPARKLIAIATQDVQPLTHYRNDVPKRLCAILERMLAKDPEHRFREAREVSQSLQTFARGSKLQELATRCGDLADSRIASNDSTFDYCTSAEIDTSSEALRADSSSRSVEKPITAFGGSTAGVWLRRVLVGLAVVAAGVIGFPFIAKRGEPPRGETPSTELLTPQTALSDTAIVQDPGPSRDGQPWTIVPKQPFGFVHGLAYSPNGTLLATAGGDRVIRIWNVQTEQLEKVLIGHDCQIGSLNWSPNGRLLASAARRDYADGDRSASVCVWDVASGTKLFSQSLPQGHTTVAWRAESDAVFIPKGLNSIGVFRLTDGVEIDTLTGECGVSGTLAASPNGKWLASGGLDATFQLWDLKTGKVVASSRKEGYATDAIAWSHDGEYVACANGIDSIAEVLVWNAPQQTQVARISVENGYLRPHSVSWSRDGMALAYTGGENHKQISIWDARSHKLRDRFDVGVEVSAVAWSPVSDEISAGSNRGGISVLASKRTNPDGVMGERVRVLSEEKPGGGAVAWATNGQTIATRNQDGISLWDVPSGRRKQRFDSDFFYAGSHRDSITMSNDSAMIAASETTDNSIVIRNLDSGNVVHDLRGHSQSVNSIAFSPDDQEIASASVDGTVRIWDLNADATPRTLIETGHPMGTVTWSRDGRFLAANEFGPANDQCWVHVWDARSWSRIKRLAISNSSQLAWSYDSTILAIDGGFWDTVTNDVWPIEHRLQSADWHPNSTSIAIGWEEILLFDVNQGVVGKRDVDFQRVTEGVTGIAWAPDGSYLAAMSGDGITWIWDASTGRLVRCLFDLPKTEYASVSSSGHYQTSLNGQAELVHVVQKPTGEQATLGTKQFRDSYAWSNDSEKTGLVVSPRNEREAVANKRHPIDLRTEGEDSPSLAPISATALVTQPTAVTGVTSWTIETRSPRGPVEGLAFNQAGDQIATGSHDGIIRVFDALNGKLTAMMVLDQPIHHLDWSPDDSLLAAGTMNRVDVWHIAEGKIVKSIESHARERQMTTWTPDGQQLVFAAGNDLRVWRKEQDTIVTVPAHSAPVRWLAMARTGTLASVPHVGEAIHVWNSADWSLEHSIDTSDHERVFGIAWSHRGSALFFNTAKDVFIHTLATKASRPLQAGPTEDYTGLVSSPTESLLGYRRGNATITLWDPATHTVVTSVDGNHGVDGHANKACFTSDGLRLALSYDSGRIAIHRAEDGEVLLQIPGIARQMNVAWSKNRNLLAVNQHSQHGLSVVDSDSGRVRRDYEVEEYRSVSWSPTSDRFATGGRFIQIWDPEHAEAVQTIETYASVVNWSDDGKSVVAATGDSIQAFNAETGEPLTASMITDEHLLTSRIRNGAWGPVVTRSNEVRIRSGLEQEPVMRIPFSREDSEAAISGDRSVLACADGRFIDLQTFTELEWSRQRGEHWFDIGWFTAVTWHPMGDLLAFSRNWDYPDSRVFFVHPESWRIIHEFVGHTSDVRSLDFSPYGRRLASGGLDGLMRIWSVESGASLGTWMLVSDGRYLAISASGHFHSSGDMEDELVYLVIVDGRQAVLTPDEFSGRYRWRNDPTQVRFTENAK